MLQTGLRNGRKMVRKMVRRLTTLKPSPGAPRVVWLMPACQHPSQIGDILPFVMCSRHPATWLSPSYKRSLARNGPLMGSSRYSLVEALLFSSSLFLRGDLGLAITGRPGVYRFLWYCWAGGRLKGQGISCSACSNDHVERGNTDGLLTVVS